jgi:hypothetical protein
MEDANKIIAKYQKNNYKVFGFKENDNQLDLSFPIGNYPFITYSMKSNSYSRLHNHSRLKSISRNYLGKITSITPIVAF